MLSGMTQLLLSSFSLKVPYFGEITSPVFPSSNAVCIQPVGELTSRSLPNVHS